MFMNTYVYIVKKRPSPPIPRPCHAHKVDTSPAFQQYHAEEIGNITPIIFNWVITTIIICINQVFCDVYLVNFISINNKVISLH